MYKIYTDKFSCPHSANHPVLKKIIMWMNLTTILLTISMIQVSAASYGQRVTYSADKVTLKKMFREITRQTGYDVVYAMDKLDNSQSVRVDFNDAPLEEVLTYCLQEQVLTYTIEDKTILIKNKDGVPTQQNGNLFSERHNKEAQVTVKGRVIDETGTSLAGATVRVKETGRATSADTEGNFTINAESDQILEVSLIGYLTEEVPIRGRTQIVVRLREGITDMDEVVVVGYGTQKKINLTGAVSEIQGSVLDNRPVAAASTGLQGLLPGVTITSSSGQPGSPNTSILIRGVSTINSQTEPLILIDGVAGGDINLINPSDIERVTVLKDAASSAIYGARAANGVILITTKKGKSEGKTALNYSGYFGVQTPISMPELVNGREYMMLENEARSARGVAIPYSDEAFARYDSGDFPNDYANTDWVDETFKAYSTQQGHNFDVNGGAGQTSYYMSYGLLDQTGLVVGDPYASTRHNVRLRLNTAISDRLRLDGNLSFIDYSRQDAGGSGTGGVFRLVQRISPLLPVWWQVPTDGGGWEDSPYWSYGSVGNPVRVAHESGYTKNSSRTFNGNFNATLDLIDGMYANAQYAYNYYASSVKDWSPTMPRFSANGTPHAANDNAVNTIAETQRSILTQTFVSTLNYEKQLAKHELKLLGGFSQEWAYQPLLSASRQNVLLEGVEEINAGTENVVNSGMADHWALRSYFGRLNYSFDNKYLFEANVRYDGTSRFAKANRWGLFPSFSAGWNFSQENFMAFSKSVLSFGKLRASWGELGNQNISNTYYPYLTEIVHQARAYPIGNRENVGFIQNALANENIQWESIRMLNLGIDLRLFRDRLDLSFDWFEKNNMNALLRPIYPTVIGITTAANLPFENIGSIENRGWELSVGWQDQVGAIRYGLTANVWDAKNKITDLGNSVPSLGNNIRRVGDPINGYYGYLTNGLAQIADFGAYNDVTGRYTNPNFALISAYGDVIQPGDIIYRDVSGPDGIADGIIDNYDKVVFGDPYPRYSYSLRTFLEWNNFDLALYFQGVGKVNGYLSEEARHAFTNDYSIPKTAHMDRWTPDNVGASYPRMYYQPNHNIVFSDYWLENASYLRLKNVQVGYRLPVRFAEKVGANRLKVYLSAENLFTITNYFGGFDPEVRETSGDAYPQMKTFVFGVQVGF
ncbi:TonB-dependent receptor [Parapedobacter tibetensis]|uniref:TonB-dependent receptor n=2 Tax=Parapedobacter tibetensis TaxID=2972951 RepID=UPI00215339B4|nr:TonB-dependent receptor [Parapedobacter tibetensis]